jgi:hypothetical protein
MSLLANSRGIENWTPESPLRNCLAAQSAAYFLYDKRS